MDSPPRPPSGTPTKDTRKWYCKAWQNPANKDRPEELLTRDPLQSSARAAQSRQRIHIIHTNFQVNIRTKRLSLTNRVSHKKKSIKIMQENTQKDWLKPEDHGRPSTAKNEFRRAPSEHSKSSTHSKASRSIQFPSRH